jgi:GTP pyrophosphokinase
MKEDKQNNHSLNNWHTQNQARWQEDDNTLIEECINLVNQHAKAVNDDIISNSINIASTLTTLNADSDTISAGILLPFISAKTLSQQQIKNFNPQVIKLAQSAINLRLIDQKQSSNLSTAQADKLRKLLLAIVDDIRVIVIKLAERLNRLNTAKQQDPKMQQQLGERIMQLYAPLANRLGIGHLKWQLEDLAFRFTHKEDYFSLSKSLNMKRSEREQFVDEMQQQISTLFQQENINTISLSGRAKHIYSIYKKTARKKVNIEKIFDTTALRAIVNTEKECYEALGIIHSNWQPIEEEFDDYISQPKANGYKSIHTAVNVPGKGHVEIQIRTEKMHQESEMGVAAHWKYKEGGASQGSYEDKIKLLRELVDWQKEIRQEQEVSYEQIFADRIYVFSPNGDIYDLPQGATALDFAYLVHTQVGHRCKGAKVNGKLVQLTQALKTGDQVEVVTGKEDHPSRDWLNPNLGYLHTTQALQKVRHYFRRLNYEKNLSLGEELWDKSCRRTGIKKNVLKELCARFNFKNSKDMLAAIGAGDIGIATVNHQARYLESNTSATDESAEKIQFKVSHSTRASNFIIEGIGNLATKAANCCKPIPGDDIIGYVTQGRGISIHRTNCRNLDEAKQRRPERLIEAQWGQQQLFITTLTVLAEDRPGLVNEITNAIVKNHINLLGLSTHVDSLTATAQIQLSIEVDSIDKLQQTLKQIQQVAGVTQVKRR